MNSRNCDLPEGFDKCVMRMVGGTRCHPLIAGDRPVELATPGDSLF